MALTIVEAAKLNPGDVVRTAIVEMYARNSDILRVLPFDNIAGNARDVTDKRIEAMATQIGKEFGITSTEILDEASQFLQAIDRCIIHITITSIPYIEHSFPDETQTIHIKKALYKALLEKYKRIFPLPIQILAIAPLQVYITSLLFPTVHPPNISLSIWLN